MEFEKIKYINRKDGEIEIEKVPGEKYLKFLYYNPLGKLTLSMLIKRKWLTAWYGSGLDKPSSVNKIDKFIEDANINRDEIKKDIKDFKSFNDFFYRELKDGARPINDNNNVFVSPADGRVLAWENISKNDVHYIKGSSFTLQELLQDKKLANKFDGGTFVIIRLAPIDYHRFHFPADGLARNTKMIDGLYYSVSTHAIRQNFRILCENKRELTIIETKNFGDVAMIEVGATMVGGIRQTFVQNTHIKKGQEKGYFYFGGSTIILLFEKDKIKIDDDILENTKNRIETKVNMGEQIGVEKIF